MFKLYVIVFFIVIWFQLNNCNAMPQPDEERYFDKEYTREIARWLAAMAPMNTNNPCNTNYGNGNNNQIMPKRNSELINSLLSLPKTMNDAGK